MAGVLPAVTHFLDAQKSDFTPGAAALKAYPWLQPSANADPVPGGYYMGADYVKYSFPLASSMSLLALSIITFPTAFNQVSGCAQTPAFYEALL